MSEHTTSRQRELFFQRHKNGETYVEIAKQMGVSRECVRYWCRRQREGKGTQSDYRRISSGLLSRFAANVRFAILRLRLEHPHWGPDRIRYMIQKRQARSALRLPSIAQIGRYLHQWERFRRRPVQRIQQTRHTLRRCFAFWNTLPERVQTDNQTGLAAARQSNDFPTIFTLWLVGLGIEHVFIRLGRPTDNAEVERCHRTVTDYAIIGNQRQPQPQLQQALDLAVHALNFELPSKAHGCHGLAPVQAHPDLLHPVRLFHPEWEVAFFDLQSVYAYLANLSWERIVSKVGRIDLGAHRYSVGARFVRKHITVRFEPPACEFAFYDGQDFIRRRPALGLSIAELTGLGLPKNSPGPQQLPLPMPEMQALQG